MLSHGNNWNQIRMWVCHETAANHSSDAHPPSHKHTHAHTHTHTQTHIHGSSSQNDSSRGLFPSLCLSINTENVGKGDWKDPKGLKNRMTAAHVPNSFHSLLVIRFFFLHFLIILTSVQQDRYFAAIYVKSFLFELLYKRQHAVSKHACFAKLVKA